MFFGNAESINDIKIYFLFPDSLACVGWQFFPHFEWRVMRLHDQGAVLSEPEQRVGVAEHLVIGGDDYLDVFQFCIGDLDRFRAQRDIEISRCTTFL